MRFTRQPQKNYCLDTKSCEVAKSKQFTGLFEINSSFFMFYRFNIPNIIDKTDLIHMFKYIVLDYRVLSKKKN